MKKSLIKERVGKIKQCPNCEATEEYGKFELITYIHSGKDDTIVEEECPSCGAHIFFSDKNEPHTITVEELLETSNNFRKMLMTCPELNSLVRNHIKNVQEQSNNIAL